MILTELALADKAHELAMLSPNLESALWLSVVNTDLFAPLDVSSCSDEDVLSNELVVGVWSAFVVQKACNQVKVGFGVNVPVSICVDLLGI